MDSDLKTTPLHAWHKSSGANMAGFGGYEMPLWYETGVKKEHLAVLESAGLFDTSHMACVQVTGPDAHALLQYCHTRDLSGMKEGRCVYGAILDVKGHVIDDAIVYRFSQEEFMVCVNAGMGGAVAAQLQDNLGGRTAVVTDLTDQLAKIDVQGKNSARIVAKILDDPQSVFGVMPYFSFKGHIKKGGTVQPVRLKDRTEVLISRSGYTGEFGFEIFVAPDGAVALWESLLEAGKEYSLTPCGLGARDSLRAGAVLPLSHQDIGERKFTNHPWMFALPMDEAGNFTKDFIGREALSDTEGVLYTLPFVGENLRKVGHGPDTQVIDANGEVLGMVLTCATDMGIGWHEGRILSVASPDLPEGFKAGGISCGFLLSSRKLEEGERVTLQEKKRKISVVVAGDIRPHRTARQKITNFIEF